MNNKVFKCLSGIIVILLILNAIQYTDNQQQKKYSRQRNDRIFQSSITFINFDLEHLENASNSEEMALISDLTANLATACLSYDKTSYYSKNNNLGYALDIMKQILTSRIHPNIAETKIDLINLIPYIKRIEENPTDSDATDELYKLIVKIR